MSPSQDEKIDNLISVLEEQNRKNGLIYSFFHGVMSGLGATVGVAIVLGVFGYLLRELAVFPKLADHIRSLIPTRIQQTIQLPHEEEIKIPIKQEPSPNGTDGQVGPKPSNSPGNTPAPSQY